MNQSTIAVIVHHGGADLLDCCLATLEGVQRRPFVVVVLNGPDAHASARFRESDWVTFVELEEGVGFSHANNLGVIEAEQRCPDWQRAFFLNNDTRVAEGALLALHRDLDAHPDCAIVGPLLVIDGAGGVINSLGLNITRHAEAWDEGIGRPLADYPERVQPGATREVLAVTGAALMIRRPAFDQINRWPEHYGFYFEDLDLCLRARSFGWKIRFVPAARVAHRISASAGQVSRFKILRSWANRFVLMASVWPLGALLATLPGLILRELAIACRRCWGRAWNDAGLQVRSWARATILLPRAIWARRRLGWHGGWKRELRDPGSVPVIELPVVERTICEGDTI